MMRKLLMVAAAIAMPLGTVAVASVTSSVATSGVSGAVTLNLSCKFSAGTVTFQATNGISDNGATTTANKSKTKTSAGALNCGSAGTGAIPAEKIKSANTVCVGTNNPIAGCATGLFVYGSGAGFSSSSTTLWQDIPTITFTVTTHSYTITNTSSNSIAPITGGKCGASESGFKIVGHISAPPADVGNPTQVITCLSTDTGPNTTGDFTTDIANVIGGTDTPKMNILTAAIDPTLSKIKVT